MQCMNKDLERLLELYCKGKIIPSLELDEYFELKKEIEEKLEKYDEFIKLQSDPNLQKITMTYSEIMDLKKKAEKYDCESALNCPICHFDYNYQQKELQIKQLKEELENSKKKHKVRHDSIVEFSISSTSKEPPTPIPNNTKSEIQSLKSQLETWKQSSEDFRKELVLEHKVVLELKSQNKELQNELNAERSGYNNLVDEYNELESQNEKYKKAIDEKIKETDDIDFEELRINGISKTQSNFAINHTLKSILKEVE